MLQKKILLAQHVIHPVGCSVLQGVTLCCYHQPGFAAIFVMTPLLLAEQDCI